MKDKCPKCGAKKLTPTAFLCGYDYLDQRDTKRCLTTQLTQREKTIEQMRDAGRQLQSALSQIDVLTMSPEQIAQDTKAVGGPVDSYCVDYIEQDVVQRVKEAFAQREKELADAKAIVDKLPKDAKGNPVAHGDLLYAWIVR